MARARNIKPGIFKNEILGAADPLLTLLYGGLWCLADREGRLENRPLRIRAEIFPYRHNVDVTVMLRWLNDHGFIRTYRVGDAEYIDIPSFKKHQSPHHTEKRSEIPEFSANSSGCGVTVKSPLNHESGTVEIPLIPDSLIPDSLIPAAKRPGAVAPAPRNKFVQPTLDDLIAALTGRVTNPMGEATKFLAYYGSNGWKVGKNPMRNWRQAVVGWAQRSTERIDQTGATEAVVARLTDRSWAK
jgi:hypothetical protein